MVGDGRGHFLKKDNCQWSENDCYPSVHARERTGAGKASVAMQVRVTKLSVPEEVEVNTIEDGGTADKSMPK